MGRRLVHREYEIGYCLAPHAWGRGLASAAVNLMLGYAFQSLAAHRLYACIDPANAASRVVVEKFDHVLRDLDLDCLPNAIPDSFEVDVTRLMVGEAIHVSDLEVPEGVHIRTHADLPVVSVVTPTVEEEPEVEEEEVVEGAEAPAEGEEKADEAKTEETEPAKGKS